METKHCPIVNIDCVKCKRIVPVGHIGFTLGGNILVECENGHTVMYTPGMMGSSVNKEI
jgi:hypothetical protein